MPGKQPVLSVIMAVHNGGKGLARTLESLEAQTFQDFELIVIDDGSTDDSWQIVTGLDRAWVRAHRHSFNKGQTAALNFGLSLAGGKFVARHDAEDTSHPERFEKQIEYFKKRPKAALVGCQVDWVDGAGRLVRHFDYPTGPKEIGQRLKTRNSFAHGAVMARREALIEAGGYREAFRLAQDYDLWLRLTEHYQAGNLSETLYMMRFSARMASVARNGEQNAYAELARKLTLERAERGQEQTDVEQAAAALAARYRGNPIARRIERARNYVAWAERLLWWGEPSSNYAWPVWQYAVTAWPFSLRVWKFVGREIMKALSRAKQASPSYERQPDVED